MEQAKPSQAEILAKKRAARKDKILVNSQERLDKITQSYNAPNPELDEKDFNSVMASIENTVQSTAEPSDGSVDSDAKQAKPSDAKKAEIIKPDLELAEHDKPLAAPALATPLFVPELNLPTIDPLEDIQPQPQQSQDLGDNLAWLHSFILSVAAIIGIVNWTLYHGHEMFDLGSLEQDVWHKKICRQLEWMIRNPVHKELGASSTISILGSTMPVWQFFLTLEAVLLTARFASLQMTKSTPFSIPEAVKPFMIQFGMNPGFYETLIGNVYGYYEMYDTLMRDMYLVIALMGVAAAVAGLSHSFGICH